MVVVVRLRYVCLLDGVTTHRLTDGAARATLVFAPAAKEQ